MPGTWDWCSGTHHRLRHAITTRATSHLSRHTLSDTGLYRGRRRQGGGRLCALDREACRACGYRGGNPVNPPVNVMTPATRAQEARRPAGRGRSPTATGTRRPISIHLRFVPGPEWARWPPCMPSSQEGEPLGLYAPLYTTLQNNSTRGLACRPRPPRARRIGVRRSRPFPVR